MLLLGYTWPAIAQNVGIGTTIPLFKLDVRSGSINTDSLYRIGNKTVLSIKGTNNLFVGENAGNITTGSGNVFAGTSAGLNNTGNDNTAVGHLALASNSAIFNVAVGNRALLQNTTGTGNTAVGTSALSNNQTGASNTGVGIGALITNSTGAANTGVGEGAVGQNTIGEGNVGIGYAAIPDNQTGNYNVAIGVSSMSANVTGSYNTGLGFNTRASGPALTNTTAIGANAYVSASNSMVLGSINGVNGAIASTRVGIGISNPSSPFHVVSPTESAMAAFDGAAGMFLIFRETGLYRGYIGSFAGNAADMDFGTGAGNVTGRVHLTLQANPRFTLDATSTNIYDAELNRTLKTGNANLVPICYGNVSSTGFVQAGSGNFTVIHSAGSGFYEIAINDEEYQFQQYITVVTPIGTSGGAVVACTGSGADRLQVQLYTLAGADIDRNFHFVVYKP